MAMVIVGANCLSSFWAVPPAAGPGQLLVWCLAVGWRLLVLGIAKVDKVATVTPLSLYAPNPGGGLFSRSRG